MPVHSVKQTKGQRASYIAPKWFGGPQSPEAIRKRISTLSAKLRKGQKITLPKIGLQTEGVVS